MDILKLYNEWCEKAADKAVLSELANISGNSEEINDRFYCHLAFGTGGLRGKLGAGTNRMSVYSVARATRGLADYLNENFTSPSIAIAYDSRNMSREFAETVAEVMSAKGVKAYIFSELMPTPVLSFAVRTLKTSAGVVVTASHNPKEYNGYKVYNEKGCQITEEAAKAVTEKIENSPYFEEICPDRSIIEVLDDLILKQFLNTVEEKALFKVTAKTPTIVYTPLNGTGNKPVRMLLDDMGVKSVYVVPEQEKPDRNFPTCPYPNPEERAALELAIKLAKEKQADLVIATDPDADRMGIAVRKTDGEYRLFNGNETGTVMENFILSVLKNRNELPESPVVVKTIVTSDMAEDIASAYGAQTVEVLTGFKYIGETIDRLKNPKDYVFGMEESYGYLVSDHVRDKDAVSAVKVLVEAACFYSSIGKSLIEVLEELYEKYGYYKTALFSATYPGEKGKEQMAALTAMLRNNPPQTICGKKVDKVLDYSLGINGLPKSNVLAFYADTLKIIVRPSGTEPKIKFYLTAKEKTEAESDGLLDSAKAFVNSLLAK